MNTPKIKPQVVKYMIAAQNMERAIEFYTTVLGFESTVVSDFWSEVSLGDVVIGLHGGGDGSIQRTGLSLQYEEVQLAYEHALAFGAKSVQAPIQNEGEPIVIAMIRDPEGNEIMLTQYVGVW